MGLEADDDVVLGTEVNRIVTGRDLEGLPVPFHVERETLLSDGFQVRAPRDQ